MADKYRTFSELAAGETRDVDFRVRFQDRRGTTLVIAPHGGGIEPGTSEITEAIAGDNFSFYVFEGIKPTDNHILHITSTRFDEPQGMALLKASPRAVSIHGEDGDQPAVFLGGRDTVLLKRIRDSLVADGFIVETHVNPLLQGTDEANICNRCQTGCGVQLELSNGLRGSFFKSLTRNGRQTKTQRFDRFVAAMRAAIL
jgi:phage replication-related protein YjqB (UPF0714/DUF867 family)